MSRLPWEIAEPALPEEAPQGSEPQQTLEIPRPDVHGLPEGAVADSVYIVGPGDRFALGIWDEAPLNFSLLVDLEGNLLIAEMGSFHAAGLTLARVKDLVRERVLRQHPRSEISVSLMQAREFRVFLTGNVARPGSYRASGMDRVSNLLADAGTPPEDASARNILLRHRDGSEVRADLLRFLRKGDPSANPFLRDGDVVLVPWIQSRVEIYGAVHDPGPYEHLEGESFSDLLGVAGGPTAAVRTDSVAIIRFNPDGITTTMRYFDSATEDPTLLPRDQVFLRAHPKYDLAPTVTLEGEFTYPMTLPITEGVTRVADAVRAAGGFTDRASVNEAVLIRGSMEEPPVDLEYERLKQIPITAMRESEYAYFKMKAREKPGKMEVDFASVLKDPSRPDNLPLRRGDLIQAPRIREYVEVVGQVASPGNVHYDPAMTLDDYISRAGGYAGNARRSHLTLIRAQSGEHLRKPGGDVRPEPGDIVWVPEKPERHYWRIVQEGLSVAASVATVVLLARQVSK